MTDDHRAIAAMLAALLRQREREAYTFRPRTGPAAEVARARERVIEGLHRARVWQSPVAADREARERARLLAELRLRGIPIDWLFTRRYDLGQRTPAELILLGEFGPVRWLISRSPR